MLHHWMQQTTETDIVGEQRDVASLYLQEEWISSEVCCIVDATHNGFGARDVASWWHAEGIG